MKPAFEFVGKRFGRLLVTERLPNVGGYTNWRCVCDCGKNKDVLGVALKHGKTRSCGCLLAEVRLVASRTHGLRKTSAYESWAHMLQRCTNPKNKDYGRYGGRGIQVCERWLEFANFLADMGPKPAGLTLDRINNDGNYEPGNCRWATRAQQAKNSTTQVLLTHAGKTLNISEWAAELGLKPDTLHMRLHRGWPLDRALRGPKSCA